MTTSEPSSRSSWPRRSATARWAGWSRCSAAVL